MPISGITFLFQIGYDLSVALSAIGIAADGDIYSDTMSIGKNASCLGLGKGNGLYLHDTYVVYEAEYNSSH